MLGFWHTYKELALLTWKYGLKILFGPIFHQLHPDSKVFLKPKLGHLETFFTWIFLACNDNDIKNMLQNGIDTADTSEQRLILKNMQFILYTAIPFVCIQNYIKLC
jgi:hypothetical protein